MKSNPGNIASHFFFTTQGFDTFRNREISTGVGAIREQLWEDRKVGRRKDFSVRPIKLTKHFIRTNIDPKWMVFFFILLTIRYFP
ncbi:hypothetical protein DCAR_0519730 [Daucus carota subsp. sativus]|uniref:Uncharacterized protein n=1 Tax=Daucus carota subsp. sativus TaxID=79200 RepID=A0AAF0X237_DAUCS|nr:hypothetical protein DCAR_0519730 [Daucus carota subsp. sativus]